jgi:hypothetical protein
MDTVPDERFADDRLNWPSDPRSTAWLADGPYYLLARHPGQFVASRAPVVEPLADVVVRGTFRKVGGARRRLRADRARPGAGAPRRTESVGAVLRVRGRRPRRGGHPAPGGDRWVALLPRTRSEAIRPGDEPDGLTAAAIGPRVIFRVNATT